METQAVPYRAGVAKQERNNLFSIKPYKNNLLTPGANYWIICIHLVILVMATSEAIAWGYLGSLFGKASVGYLAAAITFAFMFLIVWVIDVSFVTLDLSRSYYDKIILKKETERWVDNTRLGIGLLGRVMIVFVSLSISAPFLAQIVFKQDIDNEIDRRNMVRVAMVSDSMLINKDEQNASLDSLIQVREAELIQETAGKGSSGNYGFGPVTRAMESNIARLRDERASVIQDKLVLDQTMQSLTVPEFAELYNVDLIDNGVRTREEILSGLMENPEYRTAKTAITAFLAFIFAALVLLKLFQPRSVRIYYNEKLQDLYREYLAGHLNKWIATAEQSIDGESQMSPLRFEDWCVNTYSEVRNEDIKRRDSRKIYNLFKMKIEQLEEEKAEIRKMMEPVEEEYEAAMQEVNQIKIELLEAENAMRQNERHGTEIRQQLENISEDLRHNRFAGSDVLFAVKAKKEAESKLAANNKDQLALQYSYDLIRHRFEVKDADARQIEELMAKIRHNYRDIQEKIDCERLAYTDLVVGGHVIEVPGRPVVELEHQMVSQLPESDGHEEAEAVAALPAVEPEPRLTIHDMLAASMASASLEESNHQPDEASDSDVANMQEEESTDAFAAPWREMLTSMPSESHEDQETETTEESLLEKSMLEESEDEPREDPFEDAEPAYWAEALARERRAESDYDDDAENEDLETDEAETAAEDGATAASAVPWEEPEETPAPTPVKYIWENEEDNQEDSPITYVDETQLNMFADAASIAEYDESADEDDLVGEELLDNGSEEAVEEGMEEEDDLLLGDYFVDPALIPEYNDLEDAAAEDDLAENNEEAIEDDVLQENMLQHDGSGEAPASPIALNEETDDFGFTEAELAELRERINTELSKDAAEEIDAEDDEQLAFDEDLDGELLEDTILRQLESRSGRTDRKGLIRKGTFGKSSFGENA